MLADKSRTVLLGEDKPLDITTLLNSLAFLSRMIQLRGQRDFFQIFPDKNVSPSGYATMRLIQKNPGIRPASIGILLGIQESNMAKLVRELTENGWVTRQPSETDGRATSLRLSETGQTLLNGVFSHASELDRDLANALTNEEFQILLTLLGKAYRASLP